MATNNKYLKGDLPIAIGANIPIALRRYLKEDFSCNYAIANTPWLAATSDQNKMSRITTTYQKERIDQGSSAGENSLSNWWLRSATSWHHGAGEEYYDADTSDLYRFYESYNIDCWTVGNLRLLPLAEKKESFAAKSPVTVSGGTFYIADGKVKFYSSSTGTISSYTLPGGAVPQIIVTDGLYALVGASLGMYEVTTAGTITKYYDLPAGSASWTIQAMGYVKDRVIICCQITDTLPMRVFELPRVPSSLPHVPSKTADSRYENYSTIGITFVAVAEFPSAVAVAYTVGTVSKIMSFTVNTASLSSALNDPIIVGELPRNETLNQMRCYLNEFVVLGTSKGCRVGNINGDGYTFTYGPLAVDDPVVDVAFDGTYVYATRQTNIFGNYGLYRINLGQEVGNSYAAAADLVTDSDLVTGVAFVGSTNYKFITTATGVWVESSTKYAETGFLKSGWIRWGTSERKIPVSILLNSQEASANGLLGITVEDQTGTNQVVVEGAPLGSATEVALSSSLTPSDHFQVTITLSRPTATPTDRGPDFEEWQMRALPSPLRSRTITLPLLCFEEEKDSNGVTRISDPWQRIHYLERIEQSGGAVLLQDFASGEERYCVIRAIQFEQASPPPFTSGFGGIVTIQLQTIDYEEAVE